MGLVLLLLSCSASSHGSSVAAVAAVVMGEAPVDSGLSLGAGQSNVGAELPGKAGEVEAPAAIWGAISESLNLDESTNSVVVGESTLQALSALTQEPPIAFACNYLQKYRDRCAAAAGSSFQIERLLRDVATDREVSNVRNQTRLRLAATRFEFASTLYNQAVTHLSANSFRFRLFDEMINGDNTPTNVKYAKHAATFSELRYGPKNPSWWEPPGYPGWGVSFIRLQCLKWHVDKISVKASIVAALPEAVAENIEQQAHTYRIVGAWHGVPTMVRVKRRQYSFSDVEAADFAVVARVSLVLEGPRLAAPLALCKQ